MVVPRTSTGKPHKHWPCASLLGDFLGKAARNPPTLRGALDLAGVHFRTGNEKSPPPFRAAGTISPDFRK